MKRIVLVEPRSLCNKRHSVYSLWGWAKIGTIGVREFRPEKFYNLVQFIEVLGMNSKFLQNEVGRLYRKVAGWFLDSAISKTAFPYQSRILSVSLRKPACENLCFG
jgi:hypothetical protein